MAGRGGGRGRGVSNVSLVASTLGIARHEMAAYTRVSTETPALFPKVERSLVSQPSTRDSLYMAEVKSELLVRFHESPFFVDDDKDPNRVHRYTDKYKNHIDWSRIPDELCWTKKEASGGKVQKKKRKVDLTEDSAVEKLSRLEEKEGGEEEQEKDEQGEVEDRDEDEDEAVEGSDDELEDDNDYVHSYFDNGENYGDAGSDDNLDDDS